MWISTTPRSSRIFARSERHGWKRSPSGSAPARKGCGAHSNGVTHSRSWHRTDFGIRRCCSDRHEEAPPDAPDCLDILLSACFHSCQESLPLMPYNVDIKDAEAIFPDYTFVRP